MNKFISKQFGKPQGLLGRTIGLIMLIKNRARIEWVVSLLDIRTDERILEIGYGPGLAIEMIGNKLDKGKITGVDHSRAMYEAASERNEMLIYTNKAELFCCKIENLNQQAVFDKVFMINVNLFWKDPSAELLRIKNFLKPAGKLFIALQPRFAKDNNELKIIASDLEKQIITAGFKSLCIDYKTLNPIGMFCITATK